MASREGGKHKKLEPRSAAVTGSKRLPLPHWPQSLLLPNALPELQTQEGQENVDIAAAASADDPQLSAEAKATASAKDPKDKAQSFAQKFAAKKMSMRAPRFMTPPEDVTVREGETAAFTCVYEGLPRPAVRWFVDGLSVGAFTSSTRTSPAGTRGRRTGLAVSASQASPSSNSSSPGEPTSTATSTPAGGGNGGGDGGAEEKNERKYELKHDAGQRTLTLLVHDVTPEDTHKSYMCVLASHLGDARATVNIHIPSPTSGAPRPTFFQALSGNTCEIIKYQRSFTWANWICRWFSYSCRDENTLYCIELNVPSKLMLNRWRTEARGYEANVWVEWNRRA